MIEFIEGDLFADTTLDAIGHGVNCEGAMGKGIAVEFKKRWPTMYEDYWRLCRNGYLRPGGVFIWDSTDRLVWDQDGELLPPTTGIMKSSNVDTRTIFNLATQASWRTKATLNAIRESVRKMLEIAEGQKFHTIGIPRIGAGLGGLNWEDVKEVLIEEAKDSPVLLIVFSVPGAKP